MDPGYFGVVAGLLALVGLIAGAGIRRPDGFQRGHIAVIAILAAAVVAVLVIGASQG